MKRERSPISNIPIQSYTPSENSNSEGDNVSLRKIEDLQKYIKDNFTVIKPASNSSIGLRISSQPGQFKRVSDGMIFDRVYSSYANLWYPDGDAYIMSELGIGRNISPTTRKSRRNISHTTRKSRRNIKNLGRSKSTCVISRKTRKLT